MAEIIQEDRAAESRLEPSATHTGPDDVSMQRPCRYKEPPCATRPESNYPRGSDLADGRHRADQEANTREVGKGVPFEGAFKKKETLYPPLLPQASLPFDKKVLARCIQDRVPEVLNSKHIERLSLLDDGYQRLEHVDDVYQHSLHLKAMIYANAGSNDGGAGALGPIASPLNCIKPPHCVIESKQGAYNMYLANHPHLLQSPHASDMYGAAPNSTGSTPYSSFSDYQHQPTPELLEVPAASFFDIYDIKSVGPYKLIKTLGAGSTGKVKLGVHEKSGERLAIKIVPRDPPLEDGLVSKTAPGSSPASGKKKRDSRESKLAKEARLLREISLLSLLNHPHIVSLYGYTVTRSYYALYLEYVEGGQLLNYVVNHGKLKECDARVFFSQLVSAVGYCHANAIVHRDLKIENIMMGKDGRLKLIDFGLSNFYDVNWILDGGSQSDGLETADSPSSVYLSTFCGSLYYAAPELLCGRPYHGPEIDIWSLGVILYVLTTGKVPFDDKKLPLLHEKIKAGHVEYPSHLSASCVDLLKGLMCVPSQQRFTMDQICHHPWMVGSVPVSPTPVDFFLPRRGALRDIDPKVVYGIVIVLGHRYSFELVYRIIFLYILSNQHSPLKGSPIVSLCYLVKEKLERDAESDAAMAIMMQPPEALARVNTYPASPIKTHYRGYPSDLLNVMMSPPGEARTPKAMAHPIHGAEDVQLGSPEANKSTSRLPLNSNALNTEYAAEIGQTAPAVGDGPAALQPDDEGRHWFSSSHWWQLTHQLFGSSVHEQQQQHAHKRVTGTPLSTWPEEGPGQQTRNPASTEARMLHPPSGSVLDALLCLYHVLSRSEQQRIPPLTKLKSIAFKGLFSIYTLPGTIDIAANAKMRALYEAIQKEWMALHPSSLQCRMQQSARTSSRAPQQAPSVSPPLSASSSLTLANQLKLDLCRVIRYLGYPYIDTEYGLRVFYAKSMGHLHSSCHCPYEDTIRASPPLCPSADELVRDHDEDGDKKDHAVPPQRRYQPHQSKNKHESMPPMRPEKSSLVSEWEYNARRKSLTLNGNAPSGNEAMEIEIEIVKKIWTSEVGLIFKKSKAPQVRLHEETQEELAYSSGVANQGRTSRESNVHVDGGAAPSGSSRGARSKDLQRFIDEVITHCERLILVRQLFLFADSDDDALLHANAHPRRRI